MEQQNILLEDYYSLHQEISKHDDQLLMEKDSMHDVPINELSGDEVSEQSCVTTSVNSGLFASNKKATLFLTSVTIIKTIIGVGILGLPNVAKNFGLMPMIIILLTFCFLTQFNTQLLIKCKNLSKHSNYTSIGYYIFESKAILVFINLTIIFNNFGMTVSELIIYGTTIFNLTGLIYPNQDRPWYLSKACLQIIVSIVLFPLACLQRIEKLRFVGLIALTAITTFTIVIITHFFILLSKSDLSPSSISFHWFPQEFDFLNAFSCLPTVLMAYNWQFNLFPIYKGMLKPSDLKIKKATTGAMGASTVYYLIIASFGYACFGATIQADLLGIIKKDGDGGVGLIFFILLNLSYCVSTALTMPIMFFGARNNLISLLENFAFKSNMIRSRVFSVNEGENQDQEIKQIMQKRRQAKKYQELRFYLITLALWTLVVVATITLNSLEIAFNLIGSLSSNAVGGILPTLFYFKLSQMNPERFKTRSKLYLYYLVRCLFIFSLVITVVCLTSEFLH